MYVCICKGITDKDISQAIEQGNHSFSSLRKQLGIATQCGQCACYVKEQLQAELPQAIDQDLFYAAG